MIKGIQLGFCGNDRFLETMAANAPKSMLTRETVMNAFEANATHVFIEPINLQDDFVRCGSRYSAGVCRGKKLSILDNGCGMTGEELQDTMANLFSSGRGKKFIGDGGNNFGIGLRAIGAFHNPYGLIVESWVGGYGHRVITQKNARTGQYELMPNGEFDNTVLEEGITIPKKLRELAKEQCRSDDLISGTRVIFMGKDGEDNTYNHVQSQKDLQKRFFQYVRKNSQVYVQDGYGDCQRRNVVSMFDLVKIAADYGVQKYTCNFGQVLVHYARRSKEKNNQIHVIPPGIHVVWKGEIYSHTSSLEMYRALGIVLDPKAWAIYFELPSNAFTSKMDRASIVHCKDQQPFDPYEELCELIRNDLPSAIKEHQEKLAAAEDVMPKLDDWIKTEISKYIGLNSKMTHHIAGSEQMDVTETGDMSCSTIDEEPTGSGKGLIRTGDGGGGSNTDHKNTDCSVGTKKKAMTVAEALPEVVWASFLETKQESDEPEAAGSYNNEHGPRGKLTINTDFPLYKTLLRKLKDDYKLYSVSENVLADTLKRYWSLNLCVYIATVKLTFHKIGFKGEFLHWVTDQALTIQGRGGCHAYNAAKISLDGKKNSWLAKEKITRAAMSASI